MPTLAEVATRYSHEGTWVGDFFVHYSRHCGERLYIMDGRNASLPKSECPTIVFESEDRDSCDVLNSDWCKMDLQEAFELAMEADWEENRWSGFNEIKADGLIIHRSSNDAKRVMNMNRLDRFKPLKATPKKWTLPLAIRALVAGQATAYRNHRYTDDYAYDNSVNFGEGESDALWLAKRIIESPSGWRVYASSDDTVQLSCHTFESFTLTLIGIKAQ